MNHYAALDVSLRSIHICVMDEKGSIKAEGQTPSEVEDVMDFLGSLDVEITSVGFEAGTLTQYLTYGLQSAGFDVVCMEARQVKAALSANSQKNSTSSRPAWRRGLPFRSHRRRAAPIGGILGAHSSTSAQGLVGAD